MSRPAVRLSRNLFPSPVPHQFQTTFRPHLAPSSTRCSLFTIAKNHGPLKIQRVRVRSRRFTWKRLVTWSLGAGLTLFAVSTLLEVLLLGLDDDEDTGASRQQVEEGSRHARTSVENDGGLNLEGESSADGVDPSGRRSIDEASEDGIPSETPEGAWFIPLAFARRLPPTFYSGTDPEWQAFVKFARDKERQVRLKHDLCGIVGTRIRNDTIAEDVLGKNIRCRGYWLDIDYPAGPSPSYERYGLEWADDYIALLDRPVSYTAVQRVEKALWPSAVTKSAYETLKELVTSQYKRIKRAGRSGEDKDDPAQAKTNGLATQDEASATDDISSQLNQRPQSSQSPGSTSQPNVVSLLSILPEYPQDNQRIKPGLALFRRKLNKSWQPVVASSPPGSIHVQGLIEYRGTEATCTAEVGATFVVTEMKWHAVGIKIRRVQPNIQRPLGKSRHSAG